MSLVLALFALWASQAKGNGDIALFFAISSGIQGIAAMYIMIQDCKRIIIAAEIDGKRS
jgi:hypothetical protein